MVQYSKQAEKFLERQTENTRKRIRAAIAALPAGDVKKLKGVPYYRLRVGSYRVLFDKDGNVLTIIRIDNRGQVYK